MESLKVLLVEDDQTAREQLSKVIRKEGFEVITGKDGIDGLARFKKEKPEIVITDLKMPGIDGMEIVHTAKRLSPHTEIIVITGYGDSDTAITALREGALDYLKKPLDLDSLVVALGRAKEKVVEYRKVVPYPNLLLAEDDETTRGRLARILEKEGWKVYQAGDGQEALDIFKKIKIDVVLVDIKMPKKSGLETLHDMRGITNDFEALIFSGYGDESNAIEAMRNGAINFLRKPIDLDQMIIAVEKAMEKLKTDRSLKFRTRELELTRQIIAKITMEQEIVIDARNSTRRPARDFAEKLLNAIPVGIAAVDKDHNILYVNNILERMAGKNHKKVDEDFLKTLEKMGIEVDSKALVPAINKLFKSPAGTIENISTGKYSFISMVVVTVLMTEKKDNLLILSMRGERK